MPKASPLPTKALPARPNLEYLKKLAKRRVAESRKHGDAMTLAGAQLAIARELGFASWTKLKAHLTRFSKPDRAIDSSDIGDLMKAIVDRDDEMVSLLLARSPEVVNQTAPHPNWGGGPQPLHVAIESGNQRAFRALLFCRRGRQRR